MPSRVPDPVESKFRKAAMEKTLDWYEKRLPYLHMDGVEDKCFEFVHGILYIHDPERGETRAFAQSLARLYLDMAERGELYDEEYQQWYQAIKNCDVEVMTDKKQALADLVSATFLLWGSFRDCAKGANYNG